MKGILDDIYKNNYLIKKNDNIDESDQDKMKKEI